MMLPAWVVSARGGAWHVPVSGGGSLATRCGERVHGPVHARRSRRPPDDGRRVCSACDDVTARKRVLAAALDASERSEPHVWPRTDADARAA